MPGLSITIKCVPFYELSLDELYTILALRQEVFIVEQNCPFLDADGKDQTAQHMMLFDTDQNLVAYTRLYDRDAYYKGYTAIGRVVTSPRARGGGLGRVLMEESIKKVLALFGQAPIKIGAQKYLERFYQSLGFELTGNDYIEDGIAHTYMIYPAK